VWHGPIQLRADAENNDEIIPVQHDPVGAERISDDIKNIGSVTVH
jgi:hypothetical protein